MQTLVAFAFEHDVASERIEQGLRRVRNWYDRLWASEPQSNTVVAGRVGLALWSDPEDECRWPSWWEGENEVVASLYAPLGYQEVLGAGQPLSDAPRALARSLGADPEAVLKLTPPFVLAHLDRGSASLAVHTDGLGIGRWFETRTAEGWFWSNRPLAALLFAGRRAEADPLAWRRMAACDWPMGDATPYRGVRCLPAATRIVAGPQGCVTSSLDLEAHLVMRRTPLSPSSVAATADALQAVARSVSSLWPRTPVLSLSGGRDSRLVVAAFVAAGLEVKLKTYETTEGEVATARELVSRLDGRVEHEIAAPSTGRRRRDRYGAYRRALRWHDVGEGLRPSVYLKDAAPAKVLQHRRALVCGIGGEFAHAPAHPSDVARLEKLPPERRLRAFAESLGTFFVLPHGLSTQAREETHEQIWAVLTRAEATGVTDSKLFDWFYADERLRRWGMGGESAGRAIPLLTPQFVSVASGLTTAEANANALHRALINQLVPQWSDIDFYHATLRERLAAKRRRLWQEADQPLLSEIVADPTDWADAFDVEQVQAVWADALAGRAAGRDELLLQRVIWRAAFSDHLRAVNGEELSSRASWTPAPPAQSDAAQSQTTQSSTPPAGRPRRRWTRHRWVNRLTVAANDSRIARRVARTGVGRRLRRVLGV